MRNEVLEYCIQRKPKGETYPSWNELAKEVEDRFGIQIQSVSGLRSRVAEFRKLAQYTPERGIFVPKSEAWGDGLARVLPKTTTQTFERIVFLSDFHVPYHDQALIQAACEVIRDFEPHQVVLNGDMCDFFQLSRFNKSLERLDTLQDEIDLAFDVRKTIVEAANGATIRETLGNHDERLITYMEVNAPSAKSLRALKPENLLRLGELGIEHYPRQGFRLRDEFVVEHGHITRRESGATARARANDTMISGIMGHTHRLSSFHKSGYKTVSWHEQGCMCLRTPDYIVAEANWQPGIAIGMFHTSKDALFSVQLIPAIGDGFIYDGNVYGNVESESGVIAASYNG